MFDIIGKRRWFYLLSAIVTIPGLLFILLTFVPGSGLGLQFSIAYTGGTVWEVHFRDGTPEPADVLAVLDEQGLRGSEALITRDGDREYVLIRTEELSLLAPQSPASPAPDGSTPASPDGSAAPSTPASPGASVTASAAAPASTTPASVAPAVPSAAPASAAPASAAPPTSSSAPATSAPPASSAAPAAPVSPGASAAPSPSPSSSPGLGVAPGPTSVQGVPTQGRFGELATVMQERFGPIDEVRQQTSIGPVVSEELVQQTFLLILMGAAAIAGWITVRFRDYRMGLTAIVALLHDVIVVVGIFAILGSFFALQIDALFVTAMLTVIGFSVHDTIVVFDRIRENRVRHAGEPYEIIVNHSILQTVGRSINTSMTVVITLTALLLFGGDAIRAFVLALLIGIVSGTYSSIFNASPLLVDWHLWDERRKARQVAAAAQASG